MTKQNIIAIITSVITGFVFAFLIIVGFIMYTSIFNDVFTQLCVLDGGDSRFIITWVCFSIITYVNLIKKQDKKK